MSQLFRLEVLKEGRTYVVQPADTWCSLAHKFYDNPHLWWVIASASASFDATADPVIGKTIFIPEYTDMLQVVKQ